MIADVELLKRNLNILDNDDDDFLTYKLGVAATYVRQRTGKDVRVDDVPEDLIEAVLLIAGHLFLNREATTVGGQAFVLPYGVDMLMSPYRDVGDGVHGQLP